MELIDLVFYLKCPHRWLTFLLGSQTDSQSPALLNFFLLMVVFVLQRLSFIWETLIILLSVSIDFQSKSQHNAHFIMQLMNILVLIRAVFMIIWEMFHGRISLNSVLLLLLVNFVSGFKLELMYISLIACIRSSLTHLHGFQHLVLLP